MTLKEIKTLLSSTQLPVVYDFWPEGAAPGLPWICYREAGSSNFAADGIVYQAIRNIDVELYSRQKDPTSEELLEATLTAAGIFWEKSEIYLADEQAYEVIYEIEV